MGFEVIGRHIVGKLHRRGTVDITWPNGKTERFGDGSAPSAAVSIHGAWTPLRIAINPVLGLGEAYMDGTLRLENGTHIAELLKVACTNLEWSPENPNFKWAQTTRRLGAGLQQLNRLKRSRRNVAHHYDLTDELFDLFLDPHRQYSSAYYTSPDQSLDDAQVAKLALTVRKLLIDRPGLSALDIGCGWGGLAVQIAKAGAAKVHGITLSENQLAYARGCFEREGVADRVTAELIDYRNLKGRFDRISAVGMFEHVGRPNYATYFNRVYDLLADDGVMLLECCGRVDGPGDTDPFTAKYIFPGGYAPALSEMLPHIERAGFYVTDIDIWREHYAWTLDAWYERCRAAKDQIVALYDERFYRMWIFYLAAGRMACEHLGHVLFQVQLQKKVRGAVPITRDYIFSRAT